MRLEKGQLFRVVPRTELARGTVEEHGEMWIATERASLNSGTVYGRALADNHGCYWSRKDYDDGTS
jgi:hypothetical protein